MLFLLLLLLRFVVVIVVRGDKACADCCECGTLCILNGYYSGRIGIDKKYLALTFY